MKRQEDWIYGGLLHGVYNDDERFEALCKIGTGFDDSNLSKLYEQLNNHLCRLRQTIIIRILSNLMYGLRPSMYGRLERLDYLYLYSEGGDRDGKGISLRFPRFIRVRLDKDVKDATTSCQIYQMYLDSNIVDEEEFY